jgi:hypothetical protein
VKEDKKIFLILGSHAHVPSGAAESEFKNTYENKVCPFVSNLYRYSNIKAVLHYSGVLLYWIERTHPEFFMLIEDMLSRKQAEILGGGFYDPMFPLIPLQDRIGQIEHLTTYLRKHFGKRPLGCWIPLMAWEQHLVAALSASDMNYTFLSQGQFIQAGIVGEEIFFPCISEDQGKLVTIFPVFLSLEVELAEKSFSYVFIEFKKRMEEEYGSSPDNRIVSVFPEKVFLSSEEAPDAAWNRFFEEISLSENFIETVLPARFLKSNKTYKKTSFPNSTLAGSGFSPRQFIIDHDYANGIYSKMIFTNVLINQLKGDKSRKQNAKEELWKAQDSFLFTPDNGQLRHELRKAAYSSLLRAEHLSREKGKFVPSLIQHDFNFDGKKEYLFQDAGINCYIQLKGAGIFELDYLPREWNYLDCGSVASACGNGDTGRISFADALLPPESKIEDIESCYTKRARLCFNEQFDALSQDCKGKSCFILPTAGAYVPFGSMKINKCYSLNKDVLSVSYIIKNTGNDIQSFNFITEIIFSFAGEGDEFVRFCNVKSFGKDIPVEHLLDNTCNLKIFDIKNEVQILLCSERAFSGYLVPVRYCGFYQATKILPFFPLSLKAGETWENEFSLKFSY